MLCVSPGAQGMFLLFGIFSPEYTGVLLHRGHGSLRVADFRPVRRKLGSKAATWAIHFCPLSISSLRSHEKTRMLSHNLRLSLLMSDFISLFSCLCDVICLSSGIKTVTVLLFTNTRMYANTHTWQKCVSALLQASLTYSCVRDLICTQLCFSLARTHLYTLSADLWQN